MTDNRTAARSMKALRALFRRPGAAILGTKPDERSFQVLNYTLKSVY